MKILVGGIAHETNTFSSVKTDVAAFKQWEWLKGEELFQKRGVRDYVGGIIDQADSIDVDVEPIFSTFANPSGIITEETHHILIDRLVQPMRKVHNYDAVLLSLHGAGVSEYAEDFEGAILEAVRDAVGADVPIVVTLDLHANMTQKMVDLADVILGNHLYPHTDSYEIGQEAVNIAKQIVDGSLRPTMHLEYLPLAISTSTTNLSPAKDINDSCFHKESLDGVVDCTFYHGFPYTNISRFGVAVVVTTNNDKKLAKTKAQSIAQLIWESREQFDVDPFNPQEGIQEALAHEGKPVVINETSDNPGGGTPGDGTHLLRAMIESDLSDACFGYIYDPEAVKLAIEAGVGTTVHIALGGKTDDLHGEPLKLDAYVKAITDGKFIQSSPMGRGSKVNLGPAVCLHCNGVDIIVCSVNSQTLDDEIFRIHGINIQDYKIIGLKSSQHFRAGFEAISSKIITVDSPGLSTINFKEAFDYTQLEAKLYPLHDVSYES